MRPNRLPVQAKLMLPFFFIAFLIGVTGLVGIRASQNINRAFAALIDHNVPALNTLQEIKSIALEIEFQTAGFEFTEGRPAQAKSGLAADVERIDRQVRQYRQFSHAGKEAITVFNQKIQDVKEQVVRDALELIRLNEQGAAADVLLAQKQKLNSSSNRLKAIVEGAIRLEISHLKRQNALANSTVSTMIFSTLLVSVTTVLFAVLIGLIVPTAITKPILNLRDAAREIAEGAIGRKVTVRSQDEIGDLAESFNTMSAKIEEEIDTRCQEEQKFRALVESSPNGLVTVDGDGKIRFVNPKMTEMFGYAPEELLNQPLEMLMPEKVRHKHTGYRQNFFEKPSQRPMGAGLDLYGLHKDGRRLPVDISLSPFRSNGATMVLATVMDMTERREMRNRLLQAESLASLGQLAAGVAHEINNPIGFVASNFDCLQDYLGIYTSLLNKATEAQQAAGDNDFEKAAQCLSEFRRLSTEKNLDFIISDIKNLLAETQNGVERVKLIVTDLRTFAREDKDTTEHVPIEEIIEEVLHITINEIKYKAELKKEYGDTPKIWCKPQRLAQVFTNLLVNAAQAIENQGVITVKTFRKGPYAGVAISDTGQGIPRQDLKNIFRPFYTTKKVGEGTGLGLSISFDIIKDHGGDISVESEVGKGTTFTVLLPVDRRRSEEET